MATRRDIRDAIYSELESAASGTFTVTDANGNTSTVSVATDDVALINADEFESLPAVAYDDSYNRRSVNNIGRAPDATETDNSGTLTKEIYCEYRTALVTIYVAASSEIEKEPIYESVHRAFGKYDSGITRASDLHADVEDVQVLDTSSADFSDEDAPIRMDTATVEIDFVRGYEETGDVVESVDQTTDVSDTTFADLLTQ